MKIFFGVLIILIGYVYSQEMHNSLFLIIGIAIGGWLIWLPIASRLKNSNKKTEWLELAKGCEYQHYHKLTGIGINTSTRQIYLLDDEIFKKYDYADLRDWSYNIITGGTTISNRTVAEGAHNSRQMKENEANSGLFIKVKDIDHPEWRVAFPWHATNNRKTEVEIKRWMEIFQQHVNQQ